MRIPRELSIGLGVALFGILLRAAYLIDSLDDPSFARLLVDSRTYHDLAVGLSQQGVLGQEFLWQAVGYPFFLAGVYQLCGVSVLAAKIVQILLGGATCYLTWRLGRKVFGPKAGLAAGLICACYGPLIFFENQLLATGWAAFWLIALANLALGWRERATRGHGLMLGLCGAAAILVRPTFIPLVALLGVLLFLSGRRMGASWLRSLGPPALAALSLILVLGAVGVSLESKTGHWGILPPSGGINLYIGNNPDHEETINIRPGFGWEDLVDEPRRHGYEANPWAGQPYFIGKVREFAFDQPVAFLRLQGLKTLQMVSSRELGRNQDIDLHRQWSPLLGVLVFRVGAFGFPFGLLLVLATVGVATGGRRALVTVLLPLIWYAGAVVLVFVSARYRTPLIPLLAVLAGQGVVQGFRVFRKGPGPDRFRLGAAMLLVLSLAVIPGPFAQETVDYAPEFHFGVGVSHYRLEEWEPAAHHLATAVALDPQNAAPRNFLGIALARLTRFEEAVEHFEAAVALRPENGEAARNLGRCRNMASEHYLQSGLARFESNPAASVGQLRKSLSYNGLNHEAALYLAWLLGVDGAATEGSLREAQRLVAGIPAKVRHADYRILYTKAIILAKTGDFEGAIRDGVRGRDLVIAGNQMELMTRFQSILQAFRLGRIPDAKKMP